MLKESALVELLCREIESKACLGSLKSAVDVAVVYGFFAPLILIDVGLIEDRISARSRRDNIVGSTDCCAYVLSLPMTKATASSTAANSARVKTAFCVFI